MDLTDLLVSEATVPVGLHIVQTDENILAGVRRTPPVRESLIRTIRGRKCRTVTALFDEMGAALQFPYYFGENWDALDEVLRDLTDIAPVVLLLFSAADVLLSDEDESSFSTLAKMLGRAHLHWSRRDISFHSVFQCPTDEARARVSARLAASKQPFDAFDGV